MDYRYAGSCFDHWHRSFDLLATKTGTLAAHGGDWSDGEWRALLVCNMVWIVPCGASTYAKVNAAKQKLVDL